MTIRTSWNTAGDQGRWWLAPFGFRREVLRLALKAGAKGLRIPVVL